MSHAGDSYHAPEELSTVSDRERQAHRELVLRHVDFLVTLIAADQELQFWIPACGCPHATPEKLARKRRDSDSFPCLYTTVERYQSASDAHAKPRYESSCLCQDPLAESDEPLDAVAAVALGSTDRTIADRYFDRQWRAAVSALRAQEGTWDQIEELSRSELETALEHALEQPVSRKRARRLQALLAALKDDDRIEGLSLRDLPPRSYSHFQALLSSLPGVAERDAWWLLLTAFDKPVWPADPAIDRLLCDLGLLAPDEIGSGSRHKQLEESLTDRQIPALHRALAGHAARGRVTFASDDCEVRKFSLTWRARKQGETTPGSNRPVAVDLFAGAGGISHGLLRAHYDVVLAVDNDQYATDTYRLNHPELPHERVMCTDIEVLLEDEDWTAMLPKQPDIVAGGPPCQALSQAGYRSRRADDDSYSIRDDPRTKLYSRYLDAIADLQPKAVILENVEGMANEIGDTEDRVVDQIIDDLETKEDDEDQAYVADFRTIDCSNYGIPQTRNRIIVVAIREDLARKGIKPASVFESLGDRKRTAEEESHTVKQALAGLPRLRWDEGGDIVTGKTRGPMSEYLKRHDIASGTDLTFNHRAREHPMEKDRKIFEIMDPGDTGWYIKYKKDGGKWSHLIEYHVGTEDKPAFTDKYRMIHWDEPSPTIVAHLAKDANNFILPDYYEYANPDENRRDRTRNRGVTPREAARIQSFPDDYIFLGPFTSQFRQIGNAVPPVLAWHLGDVLRKIVLDDSELADVSAPDGTTGIATSDD